MIGAHSAVASIEKPRTPKRNSMAGKLGLVAAVIAAGIMLIAFNRLRNTNDRLRQALLRQDKVLKHKEEQGQTLEQSLNEFERLKRLRQTQLRQIREVYQICQTASDLPTNPTRLITAVFEQSNGPAHFQLRFTVPDGIHRLRAEVATRFNPETEKPLAATKPGKTQLLDYALVGKTGYLLTVQGGSLREQEPINLRLTSSNPEFESVEEIILAPLFHVSSISRSGSHGFEVFSPNQLSSNLAASRLYNQQDKGTKLASFRLSGDAWEGGHIDMIFRIAILSEHPDTEVAEQALSLKYRLKPEPVIEYAGHGYYYVIPSQSDSPQ